MKVQVLVAAMNQQDHKLLDEMNIRSDVIVGNQCDYNSVEHFEYNGFEARYYNFNERGVGLNRNNTLMRADGDICIFSDDDIRFFDNYVNIVLKAFGDNPKADVIVFNLVRKNDPTFFITKYSKVHGYNYLRYGTPRIAIRLKCLREKGIYFNQCFGGGTEHLFGEDSLFLHSCLKNGLKIYSCPEYIGEVVYNRESSWFKGYDEKYFRDKGCLFKTIYPRTWKLFCIQDAVRHHNRYGLKAVVAYKYMTNKE